MEPFRVTCETCRSRLKVRSPEAIGQILACPKCGSMVLIAPPAGSPAYAAASVTPGAETTSEPLLSVSSTASTIIPSDFNFDTPLEPSTTAATPTPVPAPVEEVLAEPAVPGISPLVWCAIGGAAAFVVASATYILGPSGSKATDKPATVAASPATPETSTPTSEASTPKPEEKHEAEPAAQPAADKLDPYAVKTPAEPANAAVASSPPAAPAATVADPDPKSEQPAPAAAQPPTKSEPAVAETKTPSPPPTTVALATPPAPAERPDQPSHAGGHVLKFDPLDFDPEHLSLASTPTTAAASSVPPALPADAPSADTPPQKAPDASDVIPPPAQNNNQAINVRRGAASPDESQPLDTAQHLALKVKGLELTDVPLARFAETLSNITGAAITLDPIALELNGQSPRTPISLKVSDATLDKALQDSLTEKRLALIEQDSHVTIGLAGADERHTADFDVKDLTVDGDASPIAKLVESFVAPHTWKSNGGRGTMEVQGGSLHIDQSLAVRREVLIFCERLRSARNKPLRSKYPADLLSITSPYQKLATPLGKSTTFTFLPWTRLADVFAQWQQLAGVTVLVDWSALADVNLRPSSTVACSAINRPWEESLDGTLESLGLTWWAVDAQTIQITTADALDHIERVEFYPIPKKLREEAASDEALIDSLEKQIESRPNKHGKSTAAHVELDQPSGQLIIRATPDAQRFLSTLLSASTN